jgi:hypothetical protein
LRLAWNAEGALIAKKIRRAAVTIAIPRMTGAAEERSRKGMAEGSTSCQLGLGMIQ